MKKYFKVATFSLTALGASFVLWPRKTSTAPIPTQLISTPIPATSSSFSPSFSNILRSDFASLSSNSPIEDYSFLWRIGNAVLLAVLDGHGGPQCASLINIWLPQYIRNSLEKTKDTSAALTEAFESLDNDLINGSLSSHDTLFDNVKEAVAGSCALAVHLNGEDLTVACTGDSRAVLGKRSVNGVWTSIDLSVDQTAKNPHEYSRIIDEHPNEQDTVLSRGRILGGLMPTRAFGDARYKWPIQINNSLSAICNRRVPNSYLTPPYVTATPVVTRYKLDLERDRFLIVATDGLYDCLSSEECVQIVAKYMEDREMVEKSIYPYENHTKEWNVTDDNAGVCLIRNALGPSDEKVVKLLSIPAPKSRSYRDDISVHVLFFEGRVDKKAVMENAGEKDYREIVPVALPNKKSRLSEWSKQSKL